MAFMTMKNKTIGLFRRSSVLVARAATVVAWSRARTGARLVGCSCCTRRARRARGHGLTAVCAVGAALWFPPTAVGVATTAVGRGCYAVESAAEYARCLLGVRRRAAVIADMLFVVKLAAYTGADNGTSGGWGTAA